MGPGHIVQLNHYLKQPEKGKTMVPPIVFMNSTATDNYLDHYHVLLVWLSFGCFLLSCTTKNHQQQKTQKPLCFLCTVLRCHCCTYLLCRLQNRLWTTAPEYQIDGNRLPVSLGKERTITTITTCFQPSHALRHTNPSNYLGTFQICFSPPKTELGTPVLKCYDSITQEAAQLTNTSPTQSKRSNNRINIYEYTDPRYKTTSPP